MIDTGEPGFYAKGVRTDSADPCQLRVVQEGENWSIYGLDPDPAVGIVLPKDVMFLLAKRLTNIIEGQEELMGISLWFGRSARDVHDIHFGKLTSEWMVEAVCGATFKLAFMVNLNGESPTAVPDPQACADCQAVVP